MAGLLPQTGVFASKWQFTLEHVPMTGVALWDQADVVFLYRVVCGELLMRDETLIIPSRCEAAKLLLPGWQMLQVAEDMVVSIWVK
jgi:hypothetical protein